MTQALFDIEDVESWAHISKCGRYRYELGRRWSVGPLLDWVMLNPSTADGDTDDPTIRRCIKFAKDWGFNGIRVTNLFAYRATNPDQLKTVDDPFGPDNNGYLQSWGGPMTICAWGSNELIHKHYDGQLWSGLWDRECAFMCLGYNKDGSPKHPLYVPAHRGVSPWPKTERDRVTIENNSTTL